MCTCLRDGWLSCRYQGHVSAALVLGGIDANGAYLHTVHPHGSTDALPYATMGSGSLAAMAVFENGYKDHMEVWAAALRAHAIVPRVESFAAMSIVGCARRRRMRSIW